MANSRHTNGTLFMALERGASWPQFIRQLRKAAANVQAVVQAPGEPAEQFTSRVLQRWHTLVGGSTPPHRFVLGTNASWDSISSSARQRLAHEAMGDRGGARPKELILWAGSLTSAEDQGRLLSLAGALVEGQSRAARHVRVLFKEPKFFAHQSTTLQPA